MNYAPGMATSHPFIMLQGYPHEALSMMQSGFYLAKCKAGCEDQQLQLLSETSNPFTMPLNFQIQGVHKHNPFYL
jgi:hypothetical protein